MRLVKPVQVMTPSRMRQASRPANQVVVRAPNCPQNGRMLTRQPVPVPARRYHQASAAVTAKFHLRRVAKAGHPKIAAVLPARAAKKRSARVDVKKKMASPQRRHAVAHPTAMAHRAAARLAATAVAMPVQAMLAADHDSAPRASARRVAHRAAAVATVAIRRPVDQAMAAAVMTAAVAVLAAVVLATREAAAASTVVVPVAVRAAVMVAATKAVQAPAHRAHVGAIAANRRMDAVVAARVVAAATEIAAAAAVAAASPATVDPRLQVAASALAAVPEIVTA